VLDAARTPAVVRARVDINLSRKRERAGRDPFVEAYFSQRTVHHSDPRQTNTRLSPLHGDEVRRIHATSAVP
jgi:hypothetical protein